MPFPFYAQLDAMDCGPTCLKMIAQWYGRTYSLPYLREKSYITREGVSLRGISEAAEHIGFQTIAVKIGLYSEGEKAGLEEFPLPCIAYWEQRHFVVVYKVTKRSIWIADPAHGKIKLTHTQFAKSWYSNSDKGIVLGLNPLPEFYEEEGFGSHKTHISVLLQYLRPYNRLLIQFGIGLLVGLVFQVLAPFLAQTLIDVGIREQNLHFVWLILIAQLVLFLSQTSVQYLQAWILLQIGRRINISLIADFLMRLMHLPLGFFDSKNIGDLTQRIADNHRVESFLTGSVLNIFFSILSFLVFSAILLLYDITIFGVFAIFSFLYLFWIWAFMKRRRDLDYLYFQQSSDGQQTLFEMIQGMQEIKLQGSEQKKRWQWIELQAKLFRLQSRSLRLRQYQEFGALFLNRLKDILISFIAARAVIQGNITLGMMVSVQYIVGQLQAPFEQFIDFLRSAQDARISLDRMNEITELSPEENKDLPLQKSLPTNATIYIKNLSFQYTPISPVILKNIHLAIPEGKVTAIVGASGSGKTTLLKLLLGFYTNFEGKISIGTTDFENISRKYWRSICGTVMQEGFIFSDTIAANIAESSEQIDYTKLHRAFEVANIKDFVYSLPLSYNTMIGSKGSGISQGQRQRILIARAVYKNPEYLFFDEATNALDSTNERIIMENLNQFFENKTVIIVAHRLSTVKNADQIVVLHQGEIAEIGSHQTLIQNKGMYYNLVQNQLDIENVGIS